MTYQPANVSGMGRGGGGGLSVTCIVEVSFDCLRVHLL